MTWLYILPVTVLFGLVFLNVISMMTFGWYERNPVSDLPHPWYVRLAHFVKLW